MMKVKKFISPDAAAFKNFYVQVVTDERIKRKSSG